MRASRRRKVMWGLLAAAAVVLAAGVGSLWRTANLRMWNGLVLSVRAGRLRYFWWDRRMFRIDYKPGLSLDDYGFEFELLPYFHFNTEPAYYAAPGKGQYVVAIPAWMAAGGIVGAWWVLRRRGWHHEEWQCRCGYDLRGLTRAVCPECGRARKAEEESGRGSTQMNADSI